MVFFGGRPLFKTLAALSAPLRQLEAGARYPVEVAPALRALAEEVDVHMATAVTRQGIVTGSNPG